MDNLTLRSIMLALIMFKTLNGLRSLSGNFVIEVVIIIINQLNAMYSKKKWKVISIQPALVTTLIA